MSTEAEREIIVEAVFNDPYDGVIRLLGDAQRFGFTLRSMALAADANGTASATFTFHAPVSTNAQLVAARVARHPAVQRLAAVWAELDKVALDPSQVVAA